MSELKAPPERADRAAGVPPPDAGLEGLQRQRDRKQRNQRVAAAVLAIIIALVTFGAVMRTSGAVEKRADDPTPAPSPAGIFAGVGGWIAYGNDRVQQGPLGIWAVDPTRPKDPEARIQLSERPGTPLAWSSDGSKLLIWRFHDQATGRWNREPEGSPPSWMALFVLNADGTETRVVTNNPKLGGGALGWIAGGSFSPDGSQVVFSTYERDFSQSSAERVDGIYTVDADGGTPRLVLPARSDPPNSQSDLFNPAFSPDGTQIAYLDLHGAEDLDEAGLSLRVVNADGTGVRVLRETDYQVAGVGGPAWSPDGSHIVYSSGHANMWMIGADGSGLTRMPDGYSPYWSPDGSRIAFQLSGRLAMLAIVNADGTNVQTFGHGAHGGPWNPLLSAVPGEPNSTATTGEISPFFYAIVAVGVVGVFVLVWRSRRRSPPGDSTPGL